MKGRHKSKIACWIHTYHFHLGNKTNFHFEFKDNFSSLVYRFTTKRIPATQQKRTISWKPAVTKHLSTVKPVRGSPVLSSQLSKSPCSLWTWLPFGGQKLSFCERNWKPYKCTVLLKKFGNFGSEIIKSARKPLLWPVSLFGLSSMPNSFFLVITYFSPL